jgi:uncharacterized protein YndB with AHSA1/START domain
MERLQFKITIDAPRDRIWEILWGAETYPQWTAPFIEGGSLKTDLKKGSRAFFLDSSGDGMISEIADLVPDEFMSFRHLGMFTGGVVDTEIADQEGWSGALENYTLLDVDGGTEVIVDQDLTEGSRQLFTEMWSKALQLLKIIAENRTAEAAVGENIQARGLA